MWLLLLVMSLLLILRSWSFLHLQYLYRQSLVHLQYFNEPAADMISSRISIQARWCNGMNNVGVLTRVLVQASCVGMPKFAVGVWWGRLFWKHSQSRKARLSTESLDIATTSVKREVSCSPFACVRVCLEKAYADRWFYYKSWHFRSCLLPYTHHSFFTCCI